MLIDVNKGLINISGNLINIVRIIVFAGVSVGGTERIKLNDENENAANKIPGINNNKFNDFHKSKNMIPRMRGTMENKHPNKKELHTFPRRMVFIETGHVISLSKVFCLVSQGNTTGPIEVEVKKSTITINPEMI